MLDNVTLLAEDPFLIPDFQTVDAEGRAIGQVVADGCVFDFWADHATRIVMIVEIENIRA